MVLIDSTVQNIDILEDDSRHKGKQGRRVMKSYNINSSNEPTSRVIICVDASFNPSIGKSGNSIESVNLHIHIADFSGRWFNYMYFICFIRGKL